MAISAQCWLDTETNTSKHQENRRLWPDSPRVNRKAKILFSWNYAFQWSSFWIKPSLHWVTKKNTILNEEKPQNAMSAPHLWSVDCTTLHWQKPLAVQALHNTYALAGSAQWSHRIRISIILQVVLWKKNSTSESIKKDPQNIFYFPNPTSQQPTASLANGNPRWKSPFSLPDFFTGTSTGGSCTGNTRTWPSQGPGPSTNGHSTKVSQRSPLCQSSSWVAKTENESRP